MDETELRLTLEIVNRARAAQGLAPLTREQLLAVEPDDQAVLVVVPFESGVV